MFIFIVVIDCFSTCCCYSSTRGPLVCASLAHFQTQPVAVCISPSLSLSIPLALPPSLSIYPSLLPPRTGIRARRTAIAMNSLSQCKLELAAVCCCLLFGQRLAPEVELREKAAELAAHYKTTWLAVAGSGNKLVARWKSQMKQQQRHRQLWWWKRRHDAASPQVLRAAGSPRSEQLTRRLKDQVTNEPLVDKSEREGAIKLSANKIQQNH